MFYITLLLNDKAQATPADIVTTTKLQNSARKNYRKNSCSNKKTVSNNSKNVMWT